MESERRRGRVSGWLNRTVLGVGTASFLSDVSHETATSMLPLLAPELGDPAAVLGAVEGISDAASGAAKLWAGWVSDRLRRRKPLAVAGYVLSAVSGAAIGGAARAWQAVAARSLAWAGRGIRTPPRNALLAGDVAAADYGKAFGFERALDTLGAVAGPVAAAALIGVMPIRELLWWTMAPGLMAAAAMAFLVQERSRELPAPRPFLGAIAALPATYRRYLAVVGLFGLGDFAHSMLILRAIEILQPAIGAPAASATAIGLYGAHNAAGALLAFLFGAAGDRWGRIRALAGAYMLGPIMAAGLALPPAGSAVADTILLAAIFVLAGAMRAGESALETAVAAEMLPEHQRGTGFGTLAAVNSAGDLISSSMIGLLWRASGPAAAFAAALVPMLAGAVLLAAQARRGR